MTKASRDDKPRGAWPLAALVPSLMRPAFVRRAPAVARLAVDWTQVVGPALAAVTHPEKLTGGPRQLPPQPAPQDPPATLRAKPNLRAKPGGTLAIRAPATVAFELQHMAPQLIERINAWAGFALVARLRFVAGRKIEPETLPPPPRAAEPAELRRIEAVLVGIEAPGLKAALAALGRSVAAAHGTLRLPKNK